MFIQGCHIGIATFPGVLLQIKVYESLKTEKEKRLRILTMDITLMKITERAGMVVVASVTKL